MKSDVEEQNAIRKYLLGLLPPAEQPPLEERLFTDDAFYEEFLIVEGELIDQYLTGHVSESEREGFENHFLTTPERQQKVRFARALRRYVAARGAVQTEAAAASPGDAGEVDRPSSRKLGLLALLRPRNPALSFSLAAAALLLVFGAAWVVMRGLRPRQEPRQVLTVLLTPGGLTRERGDVRQVSVPAGTDALRLQLRLAADEFQSYRATLLNAEGATVLTDEGLRSEPADGGRVLVVSVPARDVPPGDYQLRLSGVYGDGNSESADSYRFKVVGR